MLVPVLSADGNTGGSNPLEFRSRFSFEPSTHARSRPAQISFDQSDWPESLKFEQCELKTDGLTLRRWHVGKWVSPEHAVIESGPDTWDEERPTTERINGEERDSKRQTDG